MALSSKTSKVMVSVLCPVFNAERWLEATLQGLLGQQVNFRFEILIRDDASQDRSREILTQTQHDYPDIVKLFFKMENQYPETWPLEELRRVANGDYFAYCDGDDQWTDPVKLQSQLDFLQSHQDYVACHHDYVKRHWTPDYDSFRDEEIRTPRKLVGRQMMKSRGLVPWSVLFHRSVSVPEVPSQYKPFIWMQDRYYLSALSFLGPSKRVGQVLPSIYNIHSAGEFGGMAVFDRDVKMAVSMIYTARLAQKRGHRAMAREFRDDAAATMLLAFSRDLFLMPSLGSIIKLTHRLIRRWGRLAVQKVRSGDQCASKSKPRGK